MQDGCKVYMDSYMASNGSCFMVPWTIFKNHLLEIDLTQNQETTALQNLTTIEILFYFITCESPRVHRNRIPFRVRAAYDSTLHLRDRDPTITQSRLFKLSRFHGHGSWLACKAAPSLSRVTPPYSY